MVLTVSLFLVWHYPWHLIYPGTIFIRACHSPVDSTATFSGDPYCWEWFVHQERKGQHASQVDEESFQVCFGPVHFDDQFVWCKGSRQVCRICGVLRLVWISPPYNFEWKLTIVNSTSDNSVSHCVMFIQPCCTSRLALGREGRRQLIMPWSFLDSCVAHIRHFKRSRHVGSCSDVDRSSSHLSNSWCWRRANRLRSSTATFRWVFTPIDTFKLKCEIAM